MKYELVFLLSPKLSEDDAKKEVKVLQGKMEKKGATIVREDFWGRRKLAYEIRHMSHAYYVLVIFEAEGNDANEISLMLNIEKEVLRHLVINYEGETQVSLKEEEKDDKLVPQKKEAVSKKPKVVVAKKEVKKEEKKEVASKKEEPKEKEEKKEKGKETDSENLDKKLDDILEKI